MNYSRDGNADNGISNLDAENLRTFDIGANYVNSFGDIRPGLSARWGIDSAATNFAVGQTSVEGYGNIEGVKIGRIDYAPLDDFGLDVQYSLDGSAVVVTSPSASTGGSSSTASGNTPPPVTPPAAPEPVAGTQVGTMSFANQGQRSEVKLIRTEDGKVHAVDSESGHDFGTVHESRSGFGWSFDSQPVPVPVPSTPATQDPISAQDRTAIFSDGFESGNTAAWLHVGF